MRYNNFITFKPSGVHFHIIRDLKNIGDVVSFNDGKYMVIIPSYKIDDKLFSTLGAAKSFVYTTLNKKKG